jgi:hypothetical protein
MITVKPGDGAVPRPAAPQGPASAMIRVTSCRTGGRRPSPSPAPAGDVAGVASPNAPRTRAAQNTPILCGDNQPSIAASENTDRRIRYASLAPFPSRNVMDWRIARGGQPRRGLDKGACLRR